MALALFDLDETLLAGDSDYLWGRYLVEKGVVNREYYEKTNHEFYRQYQQGTLDIYEFSRFAFKPLSEHPLATLKQWRVEYVEKKIKPIITKKGMNAVEKHKQAGDYVVIITSTNRFITEPIAELFKANTLLATEPQMVNGQYTGELDVPCFAHHKIDRLNDWLKTTDHTLEKSYGYSDSLNDIPLLSTVTYPFAVDPDDNLRTHAQENNWQVISFRE